MPGSGAPRRFFVVNELGDGFWLDRDHWPQVRLHLARRYSWVASLVSALWAFGRSLSWWARLPFRLGQLLCAALLFVPAVLLLALLRTTYDTYYYRFRFFGKTLAAPRRGRAVSETMAATDSNGAAKKGGRHSAVPR